MPKKVYTLHALDCANCAAKIEAKFNAHPQVEEAVITFATRQLQLTAEDPDALIPELQALARTVESEVTIADLEDHHHEHCHHDHCECGHDHDHHHHEHGEKSELPGLLLGAGLFVAALVLEHFLGLWWLHLPVYIAAYLILGREVLATAGKKL